MLEKAQISLLLVVLTGLCTVVAVPLTVDPASCGVPPGSLNLHEVNFTAENEALLLTEGECYLGCLADGFHFQVSIRSLISAGS